jgi:tetratricopeptide (TPR) repeat protein
MMLKNEKVANNYNGLGVTIGKLGDVENAMIYLQKALKIQIEIFGEIHPDTARTYKNMGMGYYFNNFDQKAIFYLQKAKNIYEELYSNGHKTVTEINKTLQYLLNK